MPANPKQKLKMLTLLQILQNKTDEEHGLTMPELIEELAARGISAERKSIYRDFDVLRDFGYDIDTRRTTKVEYFLRRDGLGRNDLMMLVNAVQSSRFLTEQASNRLVNSIRKLASEPERKLLDKRVYVDGRVKSQNESVFHNVDVIQAAISNGRVISFQYQKFDNSLQQVSQHEGRIYERTPVRVVFADGLYYLVAWSDEHDSLGTFRIDRMRLVQELPDVPATRNDLIKNYAYDDFEYKMFGMYDGQRVIAKLHVAPGAMDTVVDRFGKAQLQPTLLRDGSAEVSVKVVKSAQFFGWVAGLNGEVTIAGPKKLADEYRAWLKDLARKVR